MPPKSLITFFIAAWFILFAPASAQNRFDVKIFRWANDHHSPASDRFYEFQSNSVKPVHIGMPLGILATGLIRKDQKAKETGVLMAAASVLNFGVTFGMKHAFNRTRPYKKLDNVHTVGSVDRSPSFPSGHTSTAFTTATALSMAYPKWYVIIPSYTWASLAGYSRMKLGMHYPTDVMMGALIGAGSAYLIFRLQKPLLKLAGLR